MFLIFYFGSDLEHNYLQCTQLIYIFLHKKVNGTATIQFTFLRSISFVKGFKLRYWWIQFSFIFIRIAKSLPSLTSAPDMSSPHWSYFCTLMTYILIICISSYYMRNMYTCQHTWIGGKVMIGPQPPHRSKILAVCCRFLGEHFHVLKIRVLDNILFSLFLMLI